MTVGDCRNVKNIVVASDLSERSRAAVQRATNLAVEHNAQLTVLHVVDNAMPDDVSEHVQADARKILQEQVTADAGARTVDFRIEVLIGDVIEEINKFTHGAKTDLLVVGPHPRRKFFDQFRETTMEHIVRSSRRPALLVIGPGDKAYAKVLIGTDLSGVCAIAVQKARMTAPRSEVTVLHAHAASYRTLAELDYATWLTRYALPADLPAPVFAEEKANNALEDAMSQSRYDLLAVGAHTRSNAGRYALRSLAARLVRDPPGAARSCRRILARGCG
jgi:nucleotide-binding universal stress UspA family protein